jgi:hypothetical protein
MFFLRQSIHFDAWFTKCGLQLLTSLTRGQVAPPQLLVKEPDLQPLTTDEIGRPSSLDKMQKKLQRDYDLSKILQSPINQKLFRMLGERASKFEDCWSEFPPMPCASTLAFSGTPPFP